MSVYFVTAREFNRVKIGFTDGDPSIRRNKIKADCPTPVALEAVMPGGRDVEQCLHRRFHTARVCGEWFTITADIELLILDHKISPPPRPPERHLPPISVHPSSEALARDLLAFCSSHDMSVTELSRRALNDKSFATGVLTRQRRVWPETERKVRLFMATYRHDTPQDAAA